MSTHQHRTSAERMAPPPVSAPAEPAPLPGFQIPPELMREAMIEGFARAFESQLQGAPIQGIIEAVKFVADMRAFKEGKLTFEQAAELLGVSMRHFERVRKRLNIAVDRSMGDACPRIWIYELLAKTQPLIQRQLQKQD